jgi:hypothetical protein
MGGVNKKRPTAMKGTINHAKESFSREIFAGAIISVVQCLAPLRYITHSTCRIFQPQSPHLQIV